MEAKVKDNTCFPRTIKVCLSESVKKIKQVQMSMSRKTREVKKILLNRVLSPGNEGIVLPRGWDEPVHPRWEGKSKPQLHPTCWTNESYSPYLSALTIYMSSVNEHIKYNSERSCASFSGRLVAVNGFAACDLRTETRSSITLYLMTPFWINGKMVLHGLSSLK